MLVEAADGGSLLRLQHMHALHSLTRDVQYSMKLDNGYGFFNECSACLMLRPVELFTVGSVPSRFLVPALHYLCHHIFRSTTFIRKNTC